MPQDRQAMVTAQSQFYRDQFRRLLTFFFFLIAVAYVLLGIVIYQHINRPNPQYFVTTADGQLIELQAIGN